MAIAARKNPVGALASQVEGADSVEIKATIAPRNIGKALKLFGVSQQSGERRFITFYDTRDLALLEAGLILRSRRVPGKPHDSTVKFRPVLADCAPAKFRLDRGFKIEADATGKVIVRSASLTHGVAKGLIKRVEAGGAPLKSLFDRAQEQFIFQMSKRRCDFSSLIALGPMDALWWKIAHPGLPWPFVAELWTRPDGVKTLEASVRVPVAQIAVANAGFLAFLAELGAVSAADQLAKTRWALQYFAGVGKKAATPVKR